MIAYVAMTTGFAPYTLNEVAWNTPLLLNAYAATGSIAGSILQLSCIIVSAFIYLPFISLDTRLRNITSKKKFNDLMEVAFSPESGRRLLQQPGDLGTIARGLAVDIFPAIKKNEIYLVYQPQVDSTTERVVGVESLIRWNHPKFGMIPPPVIIQLAEETDKIIELGEWILRTSVNQLSQWRAAGIRQLTMSVNVSSKQLEDPVFPDRYLSIIQETAISSQLVKLEVTEAKALTDQVFKNGTLQQLQKAGAKLAIDDFGMGHSSIRYLKLLQADSLKLDCILTRDIEHCENSAEIIYSINQLCSQLGVEIVAEFVETKEQLNKLQSLGCRIIQGYYYSPPLDADKIPAFCDAMSSHPTASNIS
ncbi:EAL domain-containing protein [Oleidesulfovibrio sp.]|uniref:EAL domain-containing protein n=1 Tax=Oleidesulfovibrio sp. TaxID=2909707 RepID=UPI003A8AE48F